MSCKLTYHMVITSAATAASAKFRNRNLEDGSGVVTHTTNEGRIEDKLELSFLGIVDCDLDLGQGVNHFLI